MKKVLKRIFIVILFLAVAGAAVVSAFNYYVTSSAGEYILDRGEFDNFNADYILVLGAHVRPDGTLSDMLSDRMQTGTELYGRGAASTMLLTGDSENAGECDETGGMTDFARNNGVPEENILVDTVGLSTYDSIKRAKEQLPGTRVIIVTQKYHLYRAVYIARQLGLEAYGCDSALRDYGSSQYLYTAREWGARVKDVLFVKTKQAATYGTEIQIEKYNVTDK